MPKVLVGCLVFVVLILVGGGIVGYQWIKPWFDMATGAAELASEYQEHNERLEHTDSYNPPQDGQMNEEQFQRFLDTQEQIRSQMAGRLTELEEEYEELESKLDAQDRDVNFRELGEAYQDLFSLLLDAKAAQVDALNAQNFSLEEYFWVRNQIYVALGQQVAVASMNDNQQTGQRHQVSEEVVEMVEEHREQLMETYALAWFGL